MIDFADLGQCTVGKKFDEQCPAAATDVTDEGNLCDSHAKLYYAALAIIMGEPVYAVLMRFHEVSLTALTEILKGVSNGIEKDKTESR